MTSGRWARESLWRVVVACFDSVKVPDEEPWRGPSKNWRLILHLTDRHGFGFEDVSVPSQPGLDEIHSELHEQESEHHLPTHRHRWEVIELHSGRRVSPRFETEKEAEAWAVRTFGPEGGKEYVPRLAWEVSNP